MGKYGITAVRAVERMQKGVSPGVAWNAVADEVFPNSMTSRCKSCPREAFLGLCEAGFIQGVPGESESGAVGETSRKYSVTAVRLLEAEPDLAHGSKIGLWRRVMEEVGEDPGKEHNKQMDVVLALWNQGLIGTSR